MRRNNLLLASLLLVWVVAPAGAQSLDEERTSAEIHISLPADAAPLVSVMPGERRISLVLPRGAGLPMDFSASSGGLVTGGEVTPLDGDRVQVDLLMAQGLLERIDYRPDGLVLHFESRFRALPASADPETQYKLGPDDKIAISVHNQPDLSAEVTVTDDGTISAPLVGDLSAAGLTPRQLAARLAELLGRSFLVDPQVDVEVVDFRSQWVMVGGEVRQPGRHPLRGGTRLKEVLSEAGGFTEYAGEQIAISRRQADSDDYLTLRVERADFEAGSSNPMLLDGDIVEVARAAYAYVSGEVRSPGRVLIERDMTLLKAISMVGGLTQWADRKEVRILRGQGAQSQEIVVNLKKIQRGRAEDLRLLGGEIIVVRRRFF